MKTPAISILMNTYNSEDHIKDSVESILNQLFFNFELIVIDYKSTDKTIDIIKSYNDNRITIITNDNIAKSLNSKLFIKKGDYIAYMSTHDIMLPHRLYKQYEFMEENEDIDILGSWIYNFGSCNTAVRTAVNHIEIERIALLTNPMHLSTIMIRKQSLLRLAEFNINKLFKIDSDNIDDYKLWIYFLIKGFKFTNIPIILLKHRVGKHNIRNNNKRAFKNTQLIYVEYIKKKIIEKDILFSSALTALSKLYDNKKISFDDYKYIISNLHNNY